MAYPHLLPPPRPAQPADGSHSAVFASPGTPLPHPPLLSFYQWSMGGGVPANSQQPFPASSLFGHHGLDSPPPRGVVQKGPADHHTESGVAVFQCTAGAMAFPFTSFPNVNSLMILDEYKRPDRVPSLVASLSKTKTLFAKQIKRHLAEFGIKCRTT